MCVKSKLWDQSIEQTAIVRHEGQTKATDTLKWLNKSSRELKPREQNIGIPVYCRALFNISTIFAKPCDKVNTDKETRYLGVPGCPLHRDGVVIDKSFLKTNEPFLCSCSQPSALQTVTSKDALEPLQESSPGPDCKQGTDFLLQEVALG
ncbi:hypothetical protein AK812_SmicGene41794 [Symbiodinium microadriaticum]|uniref:Uncharacterized protein n=1 Tax=Symbiodinium microadriaticum TaxID=2951 RepID=A0A1Q9C5A9_SYMMI|nr:hypothetical protein AK812_SmicGene41794 [Symbiodinium microadriaticum]